MSKTEEAFKLIWDELKRAEKEFPGWPRDIVHGAAIVQEECGELVKACLDFYYGRGNVGAVLEEAVQTGAMVYRFLFHLEDYRRGRRSGK